jgi:riboflavin kinase / FMN adenylyltransferase
MEIINGSDRLPRIGKPLYLALGNFDGIHRGHQSIIKATVSKAKEEGGLSAVLILNPHPVVALQPDRQMALLTDIADRADIMKELGLDYLILETFTRELASFTPEQFILKILHEKLSASGLYIGANYRFGKNGSGCSETLREWGKKLGYSVQVCPIIRHKNKYVSSSLIRSLLLTGDVKEAADYLNYYFYRQGRVIKGCGIGTKFVFPTANIAVEARLLWPARGVYLTAVGNVGSGLMYGVTNVGARPTFNDFEKSFAETHILDFSGDIYGREIRLCFLEKLRDTKQYLSAEELRQQITRDIEKSRQLLDYFRGERSDRGNSLQAGCSVLRSS